MINCKYYCRIMVALLCIGMFSMTLTYADETATTTDAAVVEIKKTSSGGIVKRYSINSPSMNRAIKIAVVLPPAYKTNSEQRFPVIYALHGYGAPYDTYANMSRLHHAQKDMPMIVVCFNGDKGGWYIDSPVKTDSQFMTFFYDELIPYMDSNYRTISDAKGRAVTGFSMGGFGAINYMLTKPQLFDSASALSGAFYAFGNPNVKIHKSLPLLLGPVEKYPDRYADMNVFAKIDKHAESKTSLPPVYLHCGTEDRLLQSGRALHVALHEKGYAVENLESEGAHNWKFWHGAAPGFMKFHFDEFQKQ